MFFLSIFIQNGLNNAHFRDFDRTNEKNHGFTNGFMTFIHEKKAFVNG